MKQEDLVDMHRTKAISEAEENGRSESHGKTVKSALKDDGRTVKVREQVIWSTELVRYLYEFNHSHRRLINSRGKERDRERGGASSACPHQIAQRSFIFRGHRVKMRRTDTGRLRHRCEPTGARFVMHSAMLLNQRKRATGVWRQTRLTFGLTLAQCKKGWSNKHSLFSFSCIFMIKSKQTKVEDREFSYISHRDKDWSRSRSKQILKKNPFFFQGQVITIDSSQVKLNSFFLN
jgi:hypothetical protein